MLWLKIDKEFIKIKTTRITSVIFLDKTLAEKLYDL